MGVYDGGLPVNSAVAGTVLEVRFGLRNIGDLDADEVYLTLEGPGSDSTTYPSEGKVTSLGEGESVQVTLTGGRRKRAHTRCHAFVGSHGQYEDPDRSDNDYTFSFTIDERPVEPMLRFPSRAARTQPGCPVPGTPFDIQIRVDNLGQTDASSLNLGLGAFNDGGMAEAGRATGLSSRVQARHPATPLPDLLMFTMVSVLSLTVVLSGSGVEIEHVNFGLTSRWPMCRAVRSSVSTFPTVRLPLNSSA